MNIDISAKEYRDLLDILHLADVVMTGHRREEDKRTERHRALVQKLYALAKDAGLEGLMGYNELVKKFVPTGDFEHSSLAHTVLDEFGDHLFWDQLISRLTERDADQMTGLTNRLALSGSDREHEIGHIRQRYIEEFAKNGVSNLEIIERFSAGAGMRAQTSD